LARAEKRRKAPTRHGAIKTAGLADMADVTLDEVLAALDQQVTVCCGRKECGGECGNEWRGMCDDFSAYELAADYLRDNAGRLREMDVAIAQAVEFAEYVEQHAKGKMEDAAKRFLSLPYSQELAVRLAEMDALRETALALQGRAQRAESLLREAKGYVEAQCAYAFEGQIVPYEQRARDLDKRIDAAIGAGEGR
jgi:hypothetical protein